MKKTIGLTLLTFSSLFADTQLNEIDMQLKTLTAQVQQLTQEKKAVQEHTLSMQMANASSSSSFSQSAYLPDIAFILNMSALARDVNNSAYAEYKIPGFKDENEMAFNPNRGFNFNYAEVAMSSTIDPYFDAFTIFHLSKDEFEIEEAYILTRALPYGLRVKAGKFKSDFGRINAKHQHTWNFDSQPIIYETLFGPDSISDEGMQLEWLAPTDTYIMVGIEGMQGSNERSFGGVAKNNLYNAFVKGSVDVTGNLSALSGVSVAHGKTKAEKESNVYNAELTLRYQLDSYSSLVSQSEYLYRAKDNETSTEKQAGLYSELLYNVDQNWATALRYDKITKNISNESNLVRYTAMLQYKPFPMSRIRLQYTNDRTKLIADERRTTNELMISLNIAAGAHGAHNY